MQACLQIAATSEAAHGAQHRTQRRRAPEREPFVVQAAGIEPVLPDTG